MTCREPTILAHVPFPTPMVEAEIPEGSAVKLGRVEGDLRARDHVLIQASSGSGVIVTGSAEFEGNIEVDCDLECSSLESTDGIVRVNGSLLVRGDIDVEDGLYTKGNLKAQQIDVGGRLSVGISLEAINADIGGSLEVQGNAEADTVDVGGSLVVLGESKLSDLDVGGRVELGGGEVTGTADVGGTLSSRKALKFGRIDAGGILDLTGGEGEAIEVGGRLRSKGDLRCQTVEVGGLVEIEGRLIGRRVEVGGRLAVTGDLDLSGRLEVGGIVEVGGALSAADMEVGGNLRATKALVSGGAEVGGRVETIQGLKANRVELGKGATSTGPIVGGTVHLERASRVQDVYCSELFAERGARLGRVYAESAHFEDDCVVESVVYTRELEDGDRVRHQTPPQRTASLPPFPL